MMAWFFGRGQAFTPIRWVRVGGCDQSRTTTPPKSRDGPFLRRELSSPFSANLPICSADVL
jgi:hypothetical protein